MQINLNQIKRKFICPVLEQNEWDYKEQGDVSDFVGFCIREMMAWYYRRNKQIPYDILCPLISHMGISRNIPKIKISEIQLAFKAFTMHGLYSKIEAPLVYANAQVGVGETIIAYDIPVVSSIGDKTCVIFSNPSIKTRQDLIQAYETRFCSVWSFYVLNKYPVFYNIGIEEDKIKQIKFTPNQFYIRDNKKYLRNMSDRFLDKKVYPAPFEVCVNCSRRSECQMAKTRLKQ